MAADSTLTDPEVDAALQLIQLSGDSADSNYKLAAAAAAAGGNNNFDHHLAKLEEEESVGDTVNVGNNTADEISSTVNHYDDLIEEDNLDNDEEIRPLRKRKFRSVFDLYLKTKPLLLKKQGNKKSRKN